MYAPISTLFGLCNVVIRIAISNEMLETSIRNNLLCFQKRRDIFKNKACPPNILKSTQTHTRIMPKLGNN